MGGRKITWTGKESGRMLRIDEANSMAERLFKRYAAGKMQEQVQKFDAVSGKHFDSLIYDDVISGGLLYAGLKKYAKACAGTRLWENEPLMEVTVAGEKKYMPLSREDFFGPDALGRIGIGTAVPNAKLAITGMRDTLVTTKELAPKFEALLEPRKPVTAESLFKFVYGQGE